jgi:hypothetical protein
VDYRVGALLPFLDRQEVHALIQAVAVHGPPAGVFARWLEMKAAAVLDPWHPPHPYAPMAEALSAAVAGRLRQPVVRSNYFDEPHPRVECVALHALLSTQCHVDLDHVERLTIEAAAATSPAALAAFCLPQPTLPEPLITGTRLSQEVLVDDIAYMAGRAEARRLNRGVLELRVRLIPQGQFLSCAEAASPAGPLVVVGNGTHRVLALLRAGHTHAPMLVRTAFSAEDLGLGRPGGFSPAVLQSRRPPRVADFLDPALCAALPAAKTLRSSRLTLTLDNEVVRRP